jgi:uncharacterized membrane protein
MLQESFKVLVVFFSISTVDHNVVSYTPVKVRKRARSRQRP